MKLILQHTLLVLALACAGTTVGYGQFHWTVVRDSVVDGYKYTYIKADVWNNTVVVLSTKTDSIDISKEVVLIFQDGGLSFREQPVPQLDGTSFATFRLGRRLYAYDSSTLFLIGSENYPNAPKHYQDSDRVLISRDAGNTWTQLGNHTHNGKVTNIHFCNTLEGIMLVSADTTSGSVTVNDGGHMYICTTADAGQTWTSTTFNTTQHWNGLLGLRTFANCYAYGNGMFRVFKFPDGVIYTTYDNWKTKDSTSAIPNIENITNYTFSNCSFHGDTVIAYGMYSSTGIFSYPNIEAVIVRSSDAGKSWGTIMHFPEYWHIKYISSVGNDTIIAAPSDGNGIKGLNKYLYSTDNGVSWQSDSLRVDLAHTDWVHGPVMPADGKPLGIFGGNSSFSKNSTVLIKGTHIPASVERTTAQRDAPTLYPNPTSDKCTLNFDSVQSHVTVTVCDVLGRVIDTHSFMSTSSAEVSLPSTTGAYYLRVISENNPQKTLMVMKQ